MEVTFLESRVIGSQSICCLLSEHNQKHWTIRLIHGKYNHRRLELEGTSEIIQFAIISGEMIIVHRRLIYTTS